MAAFVEQQMMRKPTRILCAVNPLTTTFCFRMISMGFVRMEATSSMMKQKNESMELILLASELLKSHDEFDNNAEVSFVRDGKTDKGNYAIAISKAIIIDLLL